MVRGPVFLARLAQDENAEFLRRRSKKESVETWDTIKRLSYNLLWQHSGRQGTICYNSERSPQPAVAFFSCVFSSSQAEMHYNSTLLQSTENILFPNIFILKVQKCFYIFYFKTAGCNPVFCYTNNPMHHHQKTVAPTPHLQLFYILFILLHMLTFSFKLSVVRKQVGQNRG